MKQYRKVLWIENSKLKVSEKGKTSKLLKKRNNQLGESNRGIHMKSAISISQKKNISNIKQNGNALHEEESNEDEESYKTTLESPFLWKN